MKFEIKITLVYFLIGILWIVFTDIILNGIIDDQNLLTSFQTYKGWFYVLITAVLLYFLLKKHLNQIRKTENELEHHKNNLQQQINEKTKDLDKAIKKLQQINQTLQTKNDIIFQKNEELQTALQNLKNTQSQLLHAEKMASLAIVTSGIAHEINNPLNYILGALTGLEDYISQNKIKNKHVSLFLHSIKTGIDRINKIVESLNMLSAKNSGLKQDCDINVIVENCLLIVHNKIKSSTEVIKNYELNETIVKGNPGQLHQAFVNILLNSIQAIGKNGIISLETKRENNQVKILFTDNGTGIKPEILPKVTDPFFTTKDPGKGVGLGLSIVFNFISEHGGKLNIESEPNAGTKVVVELPIKSQP